MKFKEYLKEQLETSEDIDIKHFKEFVRQEIESSFDVNGELSDAGHEIIDGLDDCQSVKEIRDLFDYHKENDLFNEISYNYIW